MGLLDQVLKHFFLVYLIRNVFVYKQAQTVLYGGGIKKLRDEREIYESQLSLLDGVYLKFQSKFFDW